MHCKGENTQGKERHILDVISKREMKHLFIPGRHGNETRRMRQIYIIYRVELGHVQFQARHLMSYTLKASHRYHYYVTHKKTLFKRK